MRDPVIRASFKTRNHSPGVSTGGEGTTWSVRPVSACETARFHAVDVGEVEKEESGSRFRRQASIARARDSGMTV
jgi:hypothetical protein